MPASLMAALFGDSGLKSAGNLPEQQLRRHQPSKRLLHPL